jgi:hypothetical protein
MTRHHKDIGMLLWRDIQSVHRCSHLSVIVLLGMATLVVRNGALLMAFVSVLGRRVLVEVARAELLAIEHYHGSSS